MKTCEEYVLNELEELKKENAYLKEQIEWLATGKTDSANDYEERANHYYKVIQKLVEVSHLRKVNTGREATILYCSCAWLSKEFNRKDYELLEPFAKD